MVVSEETQKLLDAARQRHTNALADIRAAEKELQAAWHDLWAATQVVETEFAVSKGWNKGGKS